jgi:glycosyltransferase involved in cell wall biosynthesis
MQRPVRLLTVVIPVYNEEACIPALFARLVELRKELSTEIDVELLYVDDGSRDRSVDLLRSLTESHDFVKLVALTRNFGQQLAVTAGIDHSKGDWVALIDADLQDPPEVIADMYRLAQRGYEVVYGQRRSRQGESAFKRITAATFYRLIGLLTDVEIPKDTGDFGLMSRRVAATLKTMRERHRFLRGMVPWTGFRSVALQYDRDSRFAGATKYPFSKMAGFAANAIFSFSAKPLAVATKLGLITAMLGAAGGTYMLYLKLFTDIPVAGVTSILVSIVFFGGVQVSLIGLLGEYVARIFEEAKGRPLYVVSETRNI